MLRFILLGVAVIASLLVTAPLYYTMNPEPVPELPPPGRAIPVSEGVAVNAIEAGPRTGAPILLVHGLPGSGYDWGPLSEDLAARGHRVIAYDRVGYGHSDPRSDEDFTFAANAQELLAVLEAENLEDVTVLGWSYGGGTAIEAAKRDPGRIGRLVLIGSAGPVELERPPPLIRLLLAGPVLRWVAQVPPLRRWIQESSSERAFSEQPIPTWWLPQVAANFAVPDTARSWLQEGAQLSIDGLDPSSIERPILVVHGDDDWLVPLDVAETIDRLAPNSDLRIVAGGSHMLPVTHPELLGGWITDFAAGRDAPVEESGGT
jgi:pimeloyl-ACP methyl ester carboxylesterase